MVFGIKAYICSSSPSYYVGEDDVLWDWLMADNAVPSGTSTTLQVPAPAGYEFRRSLSDADNTDKHEVFYVGTHSREDKACALLLMLPSEGETEFEARNIDESRIMTVFV